MFPRCSPNNGLARTNTQSYLAQSEVTKTYSVVNEVVFTTLHCLCNIGMGPIC